MDTAIELSPAEPLPPGIVRLPIAFVNAYLVDINPGVPADGWVLVDSGLRGLGLLAIQRAAARRYGLGSPPRAIVLTHGHFDHSGSAAVLAALWSVPIYAHPLELPYLTGRSDYPPPDPTVGGALAMLSRVFPYGTIDLGSRVQPLSTGVSLPFLPGWQAVPTPGHTPGHVSLWREADGVLLAGDALATLNQESWADTVTMPRELRWPPAPLTTDWEAAHDSVRRLAALRPSCVAAGHGLPLAGSDVAGAMAFFAEHFSAPSHGRYVRQPVVADLDGVVALPPPVPDPTASTLRSATLAAAVAAFAVRVARTRRG